MILPSELPEQLRDKAQTGLQAFDDAWKERGLPEAMQVAGDGMVRAQVQYQTYVDLEGVRKGTVSLRDVLLGLDDLVNRDPGPGRLTAACHQVAREEARGIIDTILGLEPGATVH